MDIKQLYYFVEAAKYGSFTQASKILFITPQALSKSIRLLEEEYGMQLFIRQNNKIILSDVGQLALPAAKELLASYHNLDQHFKKLSQTVNGSLRVAVAPNILTLLDINLFNKFSSLYPQLKLEYFELPDKIVDEYIENDQVDVCFNVNRLPNQESYNSILLLETELCVFESEKNRSFGTNNYVRLKELVNKKIVIQAGWFKVFNTLEDAARSEEIVLNYELKTSDSALILNMITMSGYISIAPYAYHGITTNELADKAVPFNPSLPWNVYLSYKKNKLLPKPAWLFINFIKENYRVKNRLAPTNP